MTIASNIASYYGGGREQHAGDGWLTFCPCHADKEKPSLKVKDNGDDDVIVHCFAGCGFKEVKDRLRADGLLQRRNGKKVDNPQPNTNFTTAPKPDEEQYIWKKGISPTKDEHAAKMITAYFDTRGIHFPSASGMPKCFRWAEYYSKKYQEDVRCVVCAVTTLQDTSVCAIQRLIVGDDGQGGIKKTAAKMLGNMEGRACYLDRKMPTSEMVTCEGIETTLSIRQAYLDADGNPTKNCVALMSTALMPAFQFPDDLMVLNIGVDSDLAKNTAQSKKGYGGQTAAIALAERFEASKPGRVAYLFTPCDSCFSDDPDKLDFNDLMQADTSGESIRARFEQRQRLSTISWRPPAKDMVVAGNDGDSPVDDPSGATQWQEMLSRYVFVQSQNKILDTMGLVIDDSMMVQQAFHVSQAGKFYRYIDEDGKLKSKQMSEYWINSPEKQVVANAVYKPGEAAIFTAPDGIRYLNTFRFAFQTMNAMDDGEIERRIKPYHELMDLVFHEHVGYMEDFLSFTVQRPGERAQIMPVVISRYGLGKSMIISLFAAVIGFNNFSKVGILDITELNKAGRNWGDWAYNKKLCCVEEVYPENDTSLRYQVHEMLKDKITNSPLALNLKGGKSTTCPVYVNIIGFSNYRDFMKIPKDDRRIFVCDSMGQDAKDKGFYQKMVEWQNDLKNLAAVYQYWMRREISDEFHPGQAKMTKAKFALQLESMNHMQAAFDYLIMHYPSDLITPGELRKAIPMVMAILSDEESVEAIGNKDKQFVANIKAAGIVTVGDGAQIRSLRRTGGETSRSKLYAIRNASTWLKKSKEELAAAYEVEIDALWAHLGPQNDRQNYSFSAPDGSDF